MVPRLDFGMMCGVGEMTFKEAFMDLYSIACVKDASVAVLLDLSNGPFSGI
jgi:hypothetical protein